jgi:hypothetical protein
MLAHGGAAGAEVGAIYKTVLLGSVGAGTVLQRPESALERHAGCIPTRGLRGLADRVDAKGGTLTIDSPHGGPTTIRARLRL